MVLLQHHRPWLALPVALRAVGHSPLDVEGWKVLAQTLVQTNNHREELAVREHILQLDNGYSTILELAECLLKNHQSEAALARYQEALSIADESADLFEVHKNIGNLQLKLRDLDGAEESYHRAFLLRPQSEVILINMGTLQMQRADYSGALAKFEEALRIVPTSDQARVGVALVHYSLGDQELALANGLAAIDLNPQNRTAVHLVANWLSKRNDHSKAALVLSQFLAFQDHDEEMALALLHCLCQTRDWDQARIVGELLLAWNPSLTEVSQLIWSLNAKKS